MPKLNKHITYKMLFEYGLSRHRKLEEIIKAKDEEIALLTKRLENAQGACQRLKEKCKKLKAE